MTQRAEFDKIELYLIRVLHTVIVERSVSRAALRLQSTQPAVSAQLKRLRELTGDPLLVRAGNGMTPTATALQLVGPAASLLQAADALFSPRLRGASFDPQTTTATFRIAASDYLDPTFLPELVAHVLPLLQEELDPDRSQALPTGEHINAMARALVQAFQQWDGAKAEQGTVPGKDGPAAFVEGRLQSLQKALTEAGAHPNHQVQLIEQLQGDADGLASAAARRWPVRAAARPAPAAPPAARSRRRNPPCRRD